MIIGCNNCRKQFDINSNLIPQKGRLLECSSCNHQWFFKKGEPNNSPKIFKKSPNEEKDEISIPQEIIENKSSFKDLNTEDQYQKKDIFKNKKKKFRILNLIIIFIISFIALIIVIDTFKQPVSFIVPNIEFILYNLYETLKDILLFFNDLI